MGKKKNDTTTEVKEVKLSERQRTLKWQIEMLITEYGVEDFEKCLNCFFDS